MFAKRDPGSDRWGRTLGGNEHPWAHRRTTTPGCVKHELTPSAVATQAQPVPQGKMPTLEIRRALSCLLLSADPRHAKVLGCHSFLQNCWETRHKSQHRYFSLCCSAEQREVSPTLSSVQLIIPRKITSFALTATQKQ